MLTRRHRSLALKTPRFQLSANYPVSIYEPSVFSAVDAHPINGHGFGFDHTGPIKAIGEYLERYVAFRNCRHTHSGTLDDTGLSTLEQQAFLCAARQTCRDPILLNDISEHKLNLVEVKRLSNSTGCLYPVSLVSLHSDSDRLESQLMPTRDSSGNSIHSCRQTALDGALLEFVERQCVTAMWMSRRCNEIDHLNEKYFHENKKSQVVLEQMLKKGTLKIYDISFLKGSSVIFTEYKSKDSDALVYFACGSSANFKRQQALVKAFIETWQTSILLTQMRFFKNRDYGSDTLKTNTQDANNPDFELGVYKQPLYIGNQNESNRQTLISSLLEVSQNIYVYEKLVWISGIELWFTRVFSPDFFIHMNPGEGNNNNNKWIDNFCDDASKRLAPLPFS